MDRQVIILGAGPAGLTAAYELCNQNIRPLVLEAGSTVGGLASTGDYKGYHYDIGGHRFYTKLAEVDQIWHDLLGDEFKVVTRLSRIRYFDKYFFYPLRPLNAFFGLGLKNSILVTLSYLHARLFPILPEESFEEYVRNRFGKRLFNIFFKVYTEKVWGIPCSEIRAEWAAQRIRGLSFTSAVVNALLASRGAHTIKSLIEQFEYPRLGPGQMWQRCSAGVVERGGTVLLNSPVTRLHRQATRITGVTALRDGREQFIAGTDFISTLALRDLIQSMCPPAPDDVQRAANGFKYRDFLLVLLIIKRRDVFPDQWLYIHTPNVLVGRIQNFKNWSRDMVPDPQMTSLGMEYFVTEGDALWSMPDEQLLELACSELGRLKLAERHEVVDGAAQRVRKAYPVYDLTYRENLAVVRGYLDALENFQTVGRNGMHKYNNQDHSMYTALLAARNIGGARNNIWAVNTDLEYQEEIIVRPESRST